MKPKEALTAFKNSLRATIERPSQQAIARANRYLNDGPTKDDIENQKLDMIIEAAMKNGQMLKYGPGTYDQRFVAYTQGYKANIKLVTDESAAQILIDQAQETLLIANAPSLLRNPFKRIKT